MIEILTLTESIVGWRDDDGGLHISPRAVFPPDARVGLKFETSKEGK